MKMRWRNILYAFLLLACLGHGVPAAAENFSQKPMPGEIFNDGEWSICTYNESDIEFLCNEDWTITTIDERTLLITISEHPYITLSLSRIPSSVKFREQLTADFFEEKNIFSENFQKTFADFAGKKAVKISAFSKTEPDMRFLNYFFVHDEELTSVLFALYPQSQWDDYKFLLQEIADSFHPLNQIPREEIVQNSP